MELAGYLYPWDVVDDPAAPELYAGLGLDHVVLAAAYHATRALTPRHPAHRIVTIGHTALYYPIERWRWGGSRLSPPPGPSSFPAAASALRRAGVAVHAWAPITHIEPWPGAPGDLSVVNVYGDRYPWALCPAQEAVQAYARQLAADLAALPDVSGIELESCGWFGLEHLHEHDKIQGVRLAPPTARLMDWCFCPACRREYAADGLEVDAVAGEVRTALDAAYSGGVPQPVGVRAKVERTRLRIAARLREEVIQTVRTRRSDLALLLHADPDTGHSHSFTGVDVASTASLVDGLVVNGWQDLSRVERAAGANVKAGLLAIEGFGGRVGELADQVAAAGKAGATGVRLYHLGLASDADLAAVRRLRS
jgi:hypothetical protein